MLWCRVRRARACVATIFIVLVALLIAGDLIVPIPNLLGTTHFAIRLALLLPLAVAIVLAGGLAAGDPLLEAVASRPVRVLDAVYAVSVAMFTLAVCAVAWQLGSTNFALAAGRNALGYIGLMLIGRRVIGSNAAGVVPSGCALTTALFGMATGGQPRWWAWPLASADDVLAWGISVALLLVGMIVALLRADVSGAEH